MKRFISYIITAVVFNIAPLIGLALHHDTGSSLLFLFLIYPITALVCGIMHGVKHGFSFLLISFTAVAFIPAMFIYFNSSAWVYMIPYVILSAIGNGTGALIRKIKLTKGN